MDDYEINTLDELVSQYEGGEELLDAVREIDTILKQPATATVGCEIVAAESETQGQYYILDDAFEIPHIKFEDSINDLRAKSRASWVSGIRKSPSNIKTPSAYFRAYFGVPAADATPIDSAALNNLQLRLPHSSE